MKHLAANVIRAAAIFLLWGASANATVLSVSDPFLQYYDIGPNNLGFTSGQLIRYGAVSVIPNASATPPTTGTATTTNLTTGNLITRTMFPDPSVVVPNFFSGVLPLCTTTCTPTGNNYLANLTGTWNITFTNSGTTNGSVTNTLSLQGSEIPFVSSITLAGTTAAPTFSWSPPAGTTVNGYRFNIYENDLEKFAPGGGFIDTGEVASITLSPGVTSHTVTSADFIHGVALKPDTQYTLELTVLQTEDNTTNVTQNNTNAISKVYSNFVIPSSDTLPHPIQLPTTTVQGNQVIYGFNFSVAPGVTYFIDPAVATGYIYQIGSGGPNFASVELPDIGNPTPYELLLWNGTSFVFDTFLAANVADPTLQVRRERRAG